MCLMDGLWPFYDHFDHRIIIFKNTQRCSLVRDVCVWRNIIDMELLPLVRHESFRLLGFNVAHGISSPLKSHTCPTN